MAIPTNLTKNTIVEAINFIEQNGIPDKNKSTKYDLLANSGKKYPPKYVIAVANHLMNGAEMSAGTYNAVEAKNFIENLGYEVVSKQENYELLITSDAVKSTDEKFVVEDLTLGDNYKPLESYFKSSQGDVIRRKYNKGERRNTNQTMPRIAFQLFENNIESLPVKEKEDFPVCQYTSNTEIIRGIFSSVTEFKKHRNSIEYLTYNYGKDRQFIIYCWNIFSTIIFVRECLKRFGNDGDQFVLTYREKYKKETILAETETETETKTEVGKQIQQSNEHMNDYSDDLIESRNIIFRGAPGTGKSYLAKKIAADIISNGNFDDYTLLTNEQKKQVEFVQFHPSYDYSDFVEGLRPKTNDTDSMGFELQEGVFTKFVNRAQKNYDDSQKKYVFIIDEINRGEISKIFGELFFAIDPEYRGIAGEVSTQYSNLHDNPDKKFSIPDNVYIIGTMNDIDRSVDSFDFAMRRRFRFIELKAEEQLEMLESLGEELKTEAIKRMSHLNNEISKVAELDENYHIGASYFLKLDHLTFEQLWTDYLQPLLHDYIRGMYDEEEIMKKFEKGYGFSTFKVGDDHDNTDNQG
ncbi:MULTISPECIES: McrB family protein [Leuconostoc gelidum group]|nr:MULTISPECIES: AAA family ATPase [Leuconostoc gelidum group]